MEGQMNSVLIFGSIMLIPPLKDTITFQFLFGCLNDNNTLYGYVIESKNSVKQWHFTCFLMYLSV